MRRIARIALLALSAPVALAPLSARPAFLTPEPTLNGAADLADPAKASYADGVSALQAGDLEVAEKAFDQALKANPRMPQPMIGLADVALRLGKRAQAQQWLEKAVQIAPNDDAALHAMSVFYFTGKEYAKAEETLKETLNKRPDNVRAWLDLGDLYAGSVNRPGEAITAYREVIKRQPDHAGAYHGLAKALASTGQYGDAEQAFRHAATLAPQLPMPFHSLAQMQVRQGQLQQALTSLDAALKIDPKFIPAIIEKGDINLTQGSTDAALALYRRAAELGPTSALAHFRLGAALQANNDLERAKEAYQTAITHDPQMAEALNNLAWLQASLRENLDQAAQYAATAVKLAPDTAAYRDTLGWVYWAQRRFPEAETVLEKAATLQPPLADVQYHLGMVYAEQKKTDLAKAAFEKALKLNPQHAEAKTALSRVGTP